MEAFILKHRKSILVTVASVTMMAVIGLLTPLLLFQVAEAQDPSPIEETVGVSATIEAFLDFSVSPTTTVLGVLVDVDQQTFRQSTSTTLTVSTNHGLGYDVDIKSANAALTGSGENIASATSTITAGTDGYGVRCSATDDTCATPYATAGEWDAKGLSLSNELFVSGDAGLSRETTLTVMAASKEDRTPGQYTDTITLTAKVGTK